MTLPKIDLPIYNLQLKTSDKNIKFRPFVVKEERILMMALESNDFETIMQAIKQVINNCVLDEIEIDDLPLFELEHLFLILFFILCFNCLIQFIFIGLKSLYIILL